MELNQKVLKKLLSITKNQKIVEAIVDSYKNHPSIIEIKRKDDEFAEFQFPTYQ